MIKAKDVRHRADSLGIGIKEAQRMLEVEQIEAMIERNELKAGIYFVNVVNSDNQSATMKLMIQE